MVLECLIAGGIDSDYDTIVRDWTPTTGDWIRIKLKGHGKSKPKRYVLANRLTKQIKQADPLTKPKQPANVTEVASGEKEQSDGEERASLDGLVFEQESEQQQSEGYGSDMLDPNNLSDSEHEDSQQIGIKRQRSDSRASDD